MPNSQNLSTITLSVGIILLIKRRSLSVVD